MHLTDYKAVIPCFLKVIWIQFNIVCDIFEGNISGRAELDNKQRHCSFKVVNDIGMGLIEFKRQSYQIESDHQFAEIDLIRTRGCAFGSVVQWKAFAENPLFENFFRRAFDQNFYILMDSENYKTNPKTYWQSEMKNWIITLLILKI